MANLRLGGGGPKYCAQCDHSILALHTKRSRCAQMVIKVRAKTFLVTGMACRPYHGLTNRCRRAWCHGAYHRRIISCIMYDNMHIPRDIVWRKVPDGSKVPEGSRWRCAPSAARGLRFGAARAHEPAARVFRQGDAEGSTRTLQAGSDAGMPVSKSCSDCSGCLVTRRVRLGS
jgi:hypothetical protein